MHKSHLVIVGLAWVASVVFVSAQKVHPSLIRNHPAIAYAKAPVSDPIAQLNGRLQSGEVTLEKNGPSGYLTSVLSALGVPIESQVLVFSKTSFQASRINPTNPRAIFFNDTVSVGWVRGGPVLEFVAQDARAGFHLLHLRAVAIPAFRISSATTPASRATSRRPRRTCRGCSSAVCFPAWRASRCTGRPTRPIIGAPSSCAGADGSSPVPTTWPGTWAMPSRPTRRTWRRMVKPETLHVTSLNGRFDMTGYLSPHSDIVALIVLEHQAQMLNLITRLGWEARVGAAEAQRPLESAVEESRGLSAVRRRVAAARADSRTHDVRRPDSVRAGRATARADHCVNWT